MPQGDEFLALLPDMAAAMAPNIDQGRHPGDTDTVAMEAVGIGHIIHTSRARGVDASALEALKALLDRAITRGHGAHSLSSIAEVLKEPSA